MMNYFFAVLGDSIMSILFPSSFGSDSTFASSSKSLAKRSNSTSPCSLKRMERPLKKTYAFTLQPSFKKACACFNLKL